MRITFEQIFASRIMLMRVQRHIAQAHVERYETSAGVMIPVFSGPAGHEAFWLVESSLQDLETKFEEKKKLIDAKSRRQLDRRADRQVVQINRRPS